MVTEFGQADLIICRSGATTTAELVAAGKAAIMIPFPLAADDHQRKNAEALERADAARMILQKDLTGDRLASEINSLIDSKEKIVAMEEAGRRLAKRDAAAATIVGGVTLAVVPVVEKLLALRLGPGAASHLEYATRLLIVPAVVFDGALAPQLLARWSGWAVTEGRAPSRREIWTAVSRAIFLAAALAVPLAVFAPRLVALLLRHGRFNANDAAAVSSLLQVLAIGFVGSMGVLLTAQAYLATSRNRLLAAVTVLRGGVRVAVAVALLCGPTCATRPACSGSARQARGSTWRG